MVLESNLKISHKMNEKKSLPAPSITELSQFITKKAYIAAGLPLKSKIVPKSPVKQSLSMLDNSNGAECISFQNNSNLSSMYNNSSKETYFEQCFYDSIIVGEGAFGVVFRARSKDDKQFYAVKRSKIPFRNNCDKKIKLEEVRKYELIPKHPNCVQLYRSWIENNYLYLQMEFCDISLESFAAEYHSIPEEMLWNILIDMLLAVKNLHDNNLIHLDIKLENILLCSNGVCKLADFGLVSDLNKNNCELMEGDQKYLAPEVLNGVFTKAADIFSLGIVMLELLLDLVLPQNGILWHRLRNDLFPDHFQNLSEQLYNLIKQMMSSNYLNRPTVDQLIETTKNYHKTSCCSFFGILSEFLSKESTCNNSIELDNIPIANSTPTDNNLASAWQLNISPISNDGTDNNKKRLHENNNDILFTPYKKTEEETPTQVNKKSRIKNTTVGRQLFK